MKIIFFDARQGRIFFYQRIAFFCVACISVTCISVACISAIVGIPITRISPGTFLHGIGLQLCTVCVQADKTGRYTGRINILCFHSKVPGISVILYQITLFIHDSDIRRSLSVLMIHRKKLHIIVSILYCFIHNRQRRTYTCLKHSHLIFVKIDRQRIGSVPAQMILVSD